MRYSKSRNAGIGHLNLTLGARNVIWAFLFHFSFIASDSWLILGGVMSARCQAAIALLRIVFLCNGWLQRAVLISCIRIIRLHGFFFISWASSHVKDDCYVGRTHRSLQDKLESIVCSMFTVPNVFGAWHRCSWPSTTTHHPPHHHPPCQTPGKSLPASLSSYPVTTTLTMATTAVHHTLFTIHPNLHRYTVLDSK